ncbi:energy-coupling factor ABC transporter permease [Catenovulum maritimum]|uniref:Uncharacterized protein n=1 Tax=Catenovulum maritimum TaxID=1513271 RepID=A0A0J8GV01_9ALTE|nr:energy-coupling factor ABC transporter permease [Catenovulum maritimum]KMT65129.1 hypothetical protein XM47_10345 [Catenovulum maritimum]
MFESIFFVFLAACVYACFDNSEFKKLLDSKSKQHLFLGFSTGLAMLWSIQTSIYAGLNVHFLWLTACTLFLGFRLAIFAGLFALTISYFFVSQAWYEFALHFVSGVFVPVSVSYLIFSYSYHHLPRHFFTYIFVASFLAGAASIICKMFSLAVFYYSGGQYDWQTLTDNYLILLLLLSFPEALLNGMTMTIGVIYFPNTVRTFSDKQYLDS